MCGAPQAGTGGVLKQPAQTGLDGEMTIGLQRCGMMLPQNLRRGAPGGKAVFLLFGYERR